MARPITPQDEGMFNEDWVEFVKYGTLTANKPTVVISKKVDTGEYYVIESIGTNGGWNIKLAIKNKNDQFGEDINGIQAPLMPVEDRYYLKIPLLFEPGDEIKLVATATNAAYNVKFDIRGRKRERQFLSRPPA